MKKHNIFISWSGDRSKLIADTFREWLPMVIQSAKPWMSSTDIEKGSRGLPEMAKALDGIKIGLTCLTPENLTASWILYEAGSLAKTVDDKTRLCTYLLGGLKNQDIEPPLGQFQHTSPNEPDTRQLLHTINKAVGDDDPLPEKTLDAIFDQFWPVLDAKLKSFPAAPKTVAKRSLEDMIAEILEFTRAETNRRTFMQSVPTLDFLTNPHSNLDNLRSILTSPLANAIPTGDSSMPVINSALNVVSGRVQGVGRPAKPAEPKKKS